MEMNNLPSSDDSARASTWGDFLNDYRQKTAIVYTLQSGRMIGAFRGEQETRNDYHGREILELIQNANDAGEGYAGVSRLHIEQTADGLCIANTGQPFSPEGVTSLFISNNSPKAGKRSRYIGSKGLGFRSVLNWTERPAILSGSLALAFDRGRASRWLDALAEAEPSVRDAVATAKAADGCQHPVAVLDVPFVFSAEFLADNPTLARAVALRTEGYETVVALPFDSPEAATEVRLQLAELGPEVLLFLPHLREISIVTPEGEQLWWRDAQPPDLVRLYALENSVERSELWQVFQEEAALPDTEQTYAVRVALREGATEPVNLFSFLPTNVVFPYPVVAHATLDLTQDRNHLQKSKANAFVLTRLALLLAQTAATVAQRSLWRGLALVSKTGSLDTDLRHFRFDEMLLEAAKHERLVPTLSGKLMLPADARLLSSGYSRVVAPPWLPSREFEEIVAPLPPGQERLSLLRALDVPTLSEGELSERLRRLSPSLDLVERSDVVAGLAEGAVDLPNPVPPLLTEASGALIETERAFLPPEGESYAPTLPFSPNWLRMRFVGGDLVRALRKRLPQSTARQLTAALEPFGIEEYALATVVSAVAAAANQHVSSEPVQEAETRREALELLLGLFRRSEGAGDVREAAVFLPNQAGRFRRATQLYLGGAYPRGVLAQALYGTFAPEMLVAAPVALGLNVAEEEAESFLIWLGVAVSPRPVTLSSLPTQSDEFNQYVRDHLIYPVRAEGGRVLPTSAGWREVNAYHWRSVGSFDRLTDILENAAPEAILAWVATEPRWSEYRRAGDTSAKYLVHFRYGQSEPALETRLPSYALYLLQRTAWLLGEDGVQWTPRECFHGGASEAVQALFPAPALPKRCALWSQLQLDRTSLHLALETAGIRLSIQDLTPDEIYEILLELPRRSVDHRAIRRFYDLLLDAFPAERVDELDCEMRSKFLRDGKLLGKRQDVLAFYAPSRLYYNDRGSISAQAARVIPLLEVQTGQGAQKVKALFGVERMERQRLTVRVESIEEHSDSPLPDEFTLLRPFLYARVMRMETAQNLLTRLRSFSLVPAARVAGVSAYEDNESEFVLTHPGESLFVMGAAESLGYVLCGAEASLSEPRTAATVASLVAECLSPLSQERQLEFQMLAMCPPSARPDMLRQWLGSDANELLDAARNAFDASFPFRTLAEDDAEEEPDPEDSPYVPPREAPEPAAKGDLFGIESDGAVEPQDAQSPPRPLPDAVGATPGSLPPEKPRRRIALRVQAKRATKTRPERRSTPVTDGTRCEEIVLLFEAAEGQGRYPLRVADMTGSAGFGCDILSFATAERRQAFLDSSDRSLIDRFIEVKGRSAGRGVLELSGNEWDRACQYRARYYLYRVYERPDGVFEVVVLPDPAGTRPDLVHVIDPFRQDQTELWLVEGTDGGSR